MRYLLPLALLAGLAACAPYQPDYAYQTQYQPGYVYNSGYTSAPGYAYPYQGGTYVQSYSSGFGSCEQSPFVWKICPESPAD